jgi:hypothetical protein
LTIRADNQVRVAGIPNQPLTASYFGFVNGDGPSSLASPAVLSTTATAASPVGVYPITVSGAASSNYNITFVAGTLNVLAPVVELIDVRLIFNRRHQVTQIILDFIGPLNVGLSETLAPYTLTVAGRHGSFTARNARTIALASAVYSGSIDSVTLVPKKPFGLNKPVQLRIHGLLPEDAVAILSKQGVHPLPGTSARLSVAAVDHLLSAGSLEETLRPRVTRARVAWERTGSLSSSAALIRRPVP